MPDSATLERMQVGLDHAASVPVDVSWQGWAEVPGGQLIASSPAVVNFGAHEYVFARRAAGQIIHTTRNDRTNTFWSAWYPVPGNGWTASPLGLTTYDGRLRLFARGLDNKVYFNTARA